MSESKGCSPVVLVLVAALMLVVGVAVGGGAAYFLAVQSPPEVAENPAPVVVTPDQPSNPTPTPAADERYAALLPLEETLRIEGPLPAAAVKETLLGGKRFKLRECYQKGVERNPDLKGEMSLQFTVAGSNGAVTAAVERHTKFSDTQVRDCVLNEIRSWKFPPQKAQSVVKFDVLMMTMSGTSPQ